MSETPVKKATAKKSPAKKAAPRKAARKATKAARKKITPRKALSNTRKLLEAKQRHARETPPWQQIGGSAPGQGHDGYQSDEAAAKANELHAAESRMEGIHGSISTHDRHAQGRRDSK